MVSTVLRRMEGMIILSMIGVAVCTNMPIWGMRTNYHGTSSSNIAPTTPVHWTNDSSAKPCDTSGSVYATSVPPVPLEDSVVAAFTTDEGFCVAALLYSTGAVKWSVPFKLNETGKAPARLAVTQSGIMAVVYNSDFSNFRVTTSMVYLDTSSGAKVWSDTAIAQAGFMPVVAGPTVAPGAGNIFVWSTGYGLWVVKETGERVWGGIASVQQWYTTIGVDPNGLIYALGSSQGSGTSVYIDTFNLTSSAFGWSVKDSLKFFSPQAFFSPDFTSFCHSIVAVPGNTYQGVFTCRNTATGKKRYSWSPQYFKTMSSISGGVLMSGGKFGAVATWKSTAGNVSLSALEPDTGKEIWRTMLPWEECSSVLQYVAPDNVFVACADRSKLSSDLSVIYELDKDTGKVLDVSRSAYLIRDATAVTISGQKNLFAYSYSNQNSLKTVAL